MGLCLYKGVAELVGVETPKIDEIIVWAQENMGKEYIREGRLELSASRGSAPGRSLQLVDEGIARARMSCRPPETQGWWTTTPPRPLPHSASAFALSKP